VLPTASASASATASASAAVDVRLSETHTYHHPGKPIETYMPHPLNETTVVDEEHCLSLRNEQQPKKLRVEVIVGSKDYEGLYVKDPSRGKYLSIPSHTPPHH
jgi:hypothetical protein